MPSLEITALILVTSLIGTIAIAAYFKAMQKGLLNIVFPFARSYALVTVALSVLFLGEILSLWQLIGAAIIVFSAIIISLKDFKALNFSAGIGYALITVFGWGLFFALLKPIVFALNPFAASLYTEGMILVFIFLYFLFTGAKIRKASNQPLKFLAGSGLLIAIGTAIGALAYNSSIQLIGAALTTASWPAIRF